MSILYILFFFIGLVVLLLFIPFRYSMHLEREGYTKVTLRAVWVGKLFRFLTVFTKEGIIHREFYVAGTLRSGTDKDYQVWLAQKVSEELEEMDEEEEKIESTDIAEKNIDEKEKDNEEIVSKKANFKEVWKYVKGISPSLWSKVAIATGSMLREIWNISKVRHCEIQGVLGVGDPAYTAMIQGAFYSLWPERTNMVSYDYLEAKLEGHLHMEGRIVPARILYILLKYVITQPMRLFIWRIFKARKDG